MQVLFVPHAYVPSLGGVERVVQELGRRFQANGNEVAVLTNIHADTPEYEEIDRIPTWRVPFIALSRRDVIPYLVHAHACRRRISEIAAKFRPDVVHMHVTSANGPYALCAARAASCPLIVTTHGSHRRDLNARGLRSEAGICRRASAITHCSRSALDQFERKHPWLRGRGQIIYNGISQERFSCNKDFDLPSRYVFYAGRLDSRKGLKILLHGWTEVDRSVKLVIAGDGPERVRLQRLAGELNLDVSWLGQLTSGTVNNILFKALAFVLPSLEEGFPVSVLEAMAAGCPIVATNVGGIPEQIEDGVHGLLVPPENPQALAQAMNRVLSDRELAARLGNNARERATTEFNWSRIAQQYLDVYTDAIDRHKSRVAQRQAVPA